MIETKYEFTVRIVHDETIRFKGREITFVINSASPQEVVKAFAMNVLYAHDQNKEQWSVSSDMCDYYRGYYIFKKESENIYRYEIFIPYSD